MYKGRRKIRVWLCSVTKKARSIIGDYMSYYYLKEVDFYVKQNP